MIRHLYISAFSCLWVIIVLASCSLSREVRDERTSDARRDLCRDGMAATSGKCVAQEKQGDDEKVILLPERSPSATKPPSSLPQQQEKRGVVNPKTGEYLQPSGTGVYSPRTGDYYLPSGSGYFNPRTGEFVPRKP
jgi:hypothetical protein